MKSFEQNHLGENPDAVENKSPEQIDSKDRDREIIQRYAREKEKRDQGKYNENKEQVNLDPELQSELTKTEKQIEELKVRGRTNEALALKQQSLKKLEEKVGQYKEAANQVIMQLPMKALETQDKPIALDTESEKGTFSDSFYKSETLAEVSEDKIDVNLLKKISTDAGQEGKIYQFTEHTQKSTAEGNEQRADTYLVTEYSNSPSKEEDKSNKVFIGFAKDHAGKYLKIFALDTKNIDGTKYTLEELKETAPVTETSSESEKPNHNIVHLQMGMEMLGHDLTKKVNIETATDEQISEFNKKLNQDWTEVNNLLTSELDSATREQEKFKELKDDLIENFLVPYSINDPEASSPYVHTEQEISERRTINQQSRDKFTEKIKTFTEYFKEDGEPLQRLAKQSMEQKLSPENIRKLADQIDQELQNKIAKLEHQRHLSEEGLINSEVLSKRFQEHKTTQEEADDLLFLHTDRAKQIADLENGTWQQPRRRRE